MRSSINQDDWENAYFKSIENWLKEKQQVKIKSIYFGGGTPSLMRPTTVQKILEKIYALGKPKKNLEITMEANPSSVEVENFSAYASAGVNRISIGVQALNNNDLKRLGRKHDVKEAMRAIEIAKHYFNNFSFDLIYGRQFQTISEWASELKTALALTENHISLYQLTIEENTRFNELYVKGMLKGMPGDTLSADFYDKTQDLCEKNGLTAYEVSNHALPGSESAHNLTYWRYQDYLGIGPGAHSRVTQKKEKFLIENFSNPEKWMDEIKSGRTGVSTRKPITKNDQADEYLMMALRLKEGASKKKYELLANKEISCNKINDLVDLGLINIEKNNLSASARGRMVLNSVIRHLIV